MVRAQIVFARLHGPCPGNAHDPAAIIDDQHILSRRPAGAQHKRADYRADTAQHDCGGYDIQAQK